MHAMELASCVIESVSSVTQLSCPQKCGEAIRRLMENLRCSSSLQFIMARKQPLPLLGPIRKLVDPLGRPCKEALAQIHGLQRKLSLARRCRRQWVGRSLSGVQTCLFSSHGPVLRRPREGGSPPRTVRRGPALGKRAVFCACLVSVVGRMRAVRHYLLIAGPSRQRRILSGQRDSRLRSAERPPADDCRDSRFLVLSHLGTCKLRATPLVPLVPVTPTRLAVDRDIRMVANLTLAPIGESSQLCLILRQST